LRPFASAEARLKSDGQLILHAGLEAADAATAVCRHFVRSGTTLQIGQLNFDLNNYERVFLISVGKAAVPMAQAIEERMGNDLVGGLAITKHEHAGGELRRVRAFEAGHPIPDQAGQSASRCVRQLAQSLTARDLLLVAISGGASALLAAPAEPITLEAKQKTTDLLLKAGATIGEMNAVRKHLSFLKGGQLAKLAYPATVLGLLLSDVVGDPLDVIGSGPTAPDESSFAEALAVLERFDLVGQVPETVLGRLREGAAGLIGETPRADDPIFARVQNVVVGSNGLALEACAREAERLGYRSRVLSPCLEGEAREVAAEHCALLRGIVEGGRPPQPPACVLSGGETTVTIRGAGKGGRNQEFALAAGIQIAGLDRVAVLSIGTDGTDGPTDAAGAFASGTTVERARELGMEAAEYLRRNDSYPFFDRLGDLIRTGPTGTNVMDVHILLAL